MTTLSIGLIGLGAMGLNLARNLTGKGYVVVALDADANARERARADGLQVADDAAALVAQLNPPRRVLLMVPAGDAVDQVLAAAAPHLQAGDVVVDLGNSHPHDSERRMSDSKTFGFLGVGMSGGLPGARHGGALMAGGDEAYYQAVAGLLQAMAATVDGEPCAEWLGPGGAGHFTKTVHNGIEYAEMQAITEARLLLRGALGMPDPEVAEVLRDWASDGDGSFLLSATIDILSRRDPASGTPVLDSVADRAGEKGTGRWCVAQALDLGVPVPSIAAAVFARALSASRPDRNETPRPAIDRHLSIDGIRSTFVLSRHAAFAQGFQLLNRAADDHGWPGNLAAVARLWRAGSILQGAAVEAWWRTLGTTPEPWQALATIADRDRAAMTQVLATGLPLPVMAASAQFLAALDASELGADLLQAQRDYFGGHGLAATDGGALFIDWHGKGDDA